MAVPNAPTDLVVTATAVGELQLVWAPAEGDAPTGYKVYSGTATGVYGDPTDVGDVLTYVDTGLDNGTEYFYTVFAYNLDGDSATGSTEDSETTWDVPDVSTNLEVTNGNGELYLTWVAPASDGGTAITGYKIYSGTVSGALSYLGATVGTEAAYTDEDLDDGATWYYTVVATNLVGDGAQSAEDSGTTFYVPDAPTTLTTVDGDTTAILTWVAPVSTGGTSISSYKIYRGVATGVLVHVGTTEDGSTLTYTDAELTNNTTYYYAVSAVNVIGEGVKSAEATAKPETSVSTSMNALFTSNDAVNIKVYQLFGGHSWTLSVPSNKTVLGMTASIISTDNLSAGLNIVVNKTNKTVKVYDGASESTNLYDVVALVYYR